MALSQTLPMTHTRHLAFLVAVLAPLVVPDDLKAQNVEIDNVVAAAQAADGTVTFYLR